jgi:transglutaminase-like putative cysteine protease
MYGRSIIRRSHLVLVFVFVFAVVAVSYGNKPPTWLTTAAGQTTPVYKKDVVGVVLLDEQNVMVEENGAIVTEERFVVKVLTKEGRDLAVARAFYLSSSGKVGKLEAWTIFKNGKTKGYGKKEMLDLISDPDDVYSEGRMRIIDASSDVNVGDIFGFTVTIENPPLFYQDIWSFQGRLPVITSRYSLSLPADWSASSITFNHADVEPVVNGSKYTWQLNRLAPIPTERMSPSIKNLAPLMAINFGPNDKAASKNRSFDNWTEVSQWASELYDPQVVINDEVAAKARELTAGLDNELAKIKAIGTYVQNMQYIAIDIGVAYGNGYKPRSSSKVLNRGYGDCKDKATLMRAMLQSLKIESYPIAIYSGDPTYVRKEWASPRQFNHCILAVVVGADTKVSTIIETEKLGRLLIFDATDDMTPVGDLPSYLQGSYGLVMAGDKGDLHQMPMTKPSQNALHRTVDVKIDGNGSIEGTINEVTIGQSSRSERFLFRRLSSSEYEKTIEHWLSSGANAAKLLKMTPKDNHEEASFDLKLEFSAADYGQLMQGRLLVFKPAIVSRSRSIYLTDKERTQPVTLRSNSFKEEAIFELPAGFSVDELPDPVSLKTDFGSYETSYKVDDGKLVFTREMTTKRSTIAVSGYAEVRAFFTKILNAENSPVVLIRD